MIVRDASGVRAGVGNTFGNAFRVTTFGESHGGGVGCIIDGCPPRLPLTEADLQIELDRRSVGLPNNNEKGKKMEI